MFTEIKKLENTQSEYFKDPLILLQSRFNRNERENEGGLTSSGDYRIERNRIENAVKSLINGEFDERKVPASFKLYGEPVEIKKPVYAAIEKAESETPKTNVQYICKKIRNKLFLRLKISNHGKKSKKSRRRKCYKKLARR